MSKELSIVLRVSAAISIAALMSACDKISLREPRDNSYQGCLRSAVEASHNLSIEDIRQLCSEAAGVSDPFYKFEKGKVVPNNEFTACYERERTSLKSMGTKDPDHLAMLLCKYRDPEDKAAK